MLFGTEIPPDWPDAYRMAVAGCECWGCQERRLRERHTLLGATTAVRAFWLSFLAWCSALLTALFSRLPTRENRVAQEEAEAERLMLEAETGLVFGSIKVSVEDEALKKEIDRLAAPTSLRLPEMTGPVSPYWNAVNGKRDSTWDGS